MREPMPRLSISPTVGQWLGAVAVWTGLCGPVHAQLPEPLPDRPQASGIEQRLRQLEEVNARLLEQLQRDREQSDRRYGELDERYLRDCEESARRYVELESRYRELERQIGEPRPAAEAEGAAASRDATARSSDLGRPAEVGRTFPVPELRSTSETNSESRAHCGGCRRAARRTSLSWRPETFMRAAVLPGSRCNAVEAATSAFRVAASMVGKSLTFQAFFAS